MTYHTYVGRLYRWRDKPSCDDLDCGCGEARGEHEFCIHIGGKDADDALVRLAVSLENDGCTILSAEMIGEQVAPEREDDLNEMPQMQARPPSPAR